MTESTSAAPGAAQPPVVLRVVSGSPSPEQVAALVGIFAAMSRGGGPPAPTTSAWTVASKSRRSPQRRSADAWRLSLRSR